MMLDRAHEQPSVVECPKGNRFELRRIDCPICGRSDQKVLGARGGAHQRWGLGVETPIVRCETCGLLFANPFPFAVDPQRLYGDPDSYFAAFEVDGKIQGSRAIVKELLTRTGARPRILDVGAGRGEFLRAAQLEGVTDVLGLELSNAMAEGARKQFGIDIEMLTVEDFAKTKPKPFDAVVLNAVLEHVYDPSAFIAAVAAVTAPGGWVYVDVPAEPNLLTMVGNATNRIRGKRSVLNLQPTWPPFHVFGFSPRTLKILLEKHGYEVQSVKVWAAPEVRHREGDRVDAVRSFVATQVNRLANVTGLASNMYVWARKRVRA
jgi:SAM-dependent methyltransferase